MIKCARLKSAYSFCIAQHETRLNSLPQLISPWIFVRYMIVGLYVGVATVGVFAYWYIGYNWSEYQHPLVSFTHLSNWGKCQHFGELFPETPYNVRFPHLADPSSPCTLIRPVCWSW